MRPAIARPTTPPRGAIHDDRRVGESPPGRNIRDVAHPSHPGRGGGDVSAQPAGPAWKIWRRHDPSRPVPGGPTGNRTRRRHDLADHAEREASTPPRAGPAWTRRQPQARSDPSKNSTMMAVRSSLRRAVEDSGRFRQAQQPDSDTFTHRHMDWTGRSPPPRWMRRCPALTRTPGRRRPPLPSGNPFPMRASRGSALSRPIPACPSAVTASAPRPGYSPRHPATRSPTARATGPYDPATPATGPDSWTIPRTTRPLKPRTASRHRHDPTPPRSLSPTARKTPNTPVLVDGEVLVGCGGPAGPERPDTRGQGVVHAVEPE